MVVVVSMTLLVVGDAGATTAEGWLAKLIPIHIRRTNATMAEMATDAISFRSIRSRFVLARVIVITNFEKIMKDFLELKRPLERSKPHRSWNLTDDSTEKDCPIYIL